MAGPPATENLLLRRGVTFAVLASIAAVLLALAWPAGAETVLRLLLALLAAGAAAWQLRRVRWPARSDPSTSPFRATGGDRFDRKLPVGLRDLTDDLAATLRSAPAGAIPFSTRGTLRDELRRRLADSHGLDARVPEHVPRIQRLISPPAWALIQPPPPGQHRALDQPVHLQYLSMIIDDVERL
ncbi:hypothetical protein Athai_39380 [Actinocatenispora thailandica]|uniref:Uncharacterized protein n=1 Tax=Actinocatenispora thailandica TaxID=227318 RepID=A0A7R7DR93_9ACTN|nr:hypothetical protein [Actinocatenispora thailandica]BCJ36435.1 hypothetical protein Athai_39380 [Actinocatenispora thailandica]